MTHSLEISPQKSLPIIPKAYKSSPISLPITHLFLRAIAAHGNMSLHFLRCLFLNFFYSFPTHHKLPTSGWASRLALAFFFRHSHSSHSASSIRFLRNPVICGLSTLKRLSLQDARIWLEKSWESVRVRPSYFICFTI